MFPAAFDYRVPGSLAEAVDILHQRGDDAKVMAGGQSLIPLLNPPWWWTSGGCRTWPRSRSATAT